jgi:CBS domain-containing protein
MPEFAASLKPAVASARENCRGNNAVTLASGPVLPKCRIAGSLLSRGAGPKPRAKAQAPTPTEGVTHMQVSQILRQKGREVVSLSASASLSEAVQLLARKRIGAVVVKDELGALAGILSERDVVRALASESPHALTRPCSDYMTRTVATCREQDTVEALMEMMTQGRFRHVPVLDEGGSLCGLVSIGDVVKMQIEEITREAHNLRSYIAAG